MQISVFFSGKCPYFQLLEDNLHKYGYIARDPSSMAELDMAGPHDWWDVVWVHNEALPPGPPQ